MDRKPANILFILADEHRWDCLGCTGNPDIRTPAIDAIAGDGTVFDHSFCCYPVCTPSRYSMLSGLYPHQHGGWSNISTLAPGLPALPRILREQGYDTACVGKMHFTPAYLDVGFARMTLAEQDGSGRMVDDYHTMLMENGLLDRFDIMDQRSEYRKYAGEDYWKSFGSGASDLPEKYHSTTWIGEQALRELENWSADRPNFLMVGFIKPHHPFDPPAEWLHIYDPEKLSILPGWTESLPGADDRKEKPYFPNGPMNEQTIRRVEACYYACISHMDHWIGRMTDVLKEKGLYDDTLIIYAADHGDYMGYHHMLLKSNFMYEPVIRVPFIVKKPEGFCGKAAQASGENVRPAGAAAQSAEYAGRPGGHDARLVSTVDLPASILAWSGNEKKDIYGSVMDEQDREFVFAEANMHDGWNYMVRSRKYKYLMYPGCERFFDLEEDPAELNDLAADPDPGIRREMERCRARLVQWMLQESTGPVYRDPGAPKAGTDEQKERDPEVLSGYFEKNFTPVSMNMPE